MFAQFFLSIFTPTAQACDPAPLMPEQFFPTEGATNVPVDSQIVLTSSGSMGFEAFDVVVQQGTENISGNIEHICNSGEHWDMVCYAIFTPSAPFQPNTTYAVSVPNPDLYWPVEGTFTTGDANTILVEQSPSLSLDSLAHYEADDFCGIDANYTYTFSVGNLIVSDDNNTHIYLNQVSADGAVIALEKLKHVGAATQNISAKISSHSGCFSVAHYHQNGALIGESEILCTEEEPEGPVDTGSPETPEDTGTEIEPDDGNEEDSPAPENADEEGSINTDEEKGCATTTVRSATTGWFSLVGLIALLRIQRRR